MRPPVLRLFSDELIVDNFAGGGGASTGIEMALGRSPDIAVNHDPEALSMHEANHPQTKHFCESVWTVNPVKVCGGKRVRLAWFSPDCKHFSKAKGGKPVNKQIRGLAWVAVKWAKAVKPDIIILENVEEFVTWGPVLEDGSPCKLRKGQTFKRFVKQLQNLGYLVDWQQFKACDYNTPTIRKRLFLVARCDGQQIVWPEPTNGRGLLPYRTAAECIDWSIPCPSIFTRKKPLAEATLRRIANGIKRYVIDAAEPFIVPLTHQGGDRVESLSEPMRTVTGAHRGERALVTPFLARIGQTGGKGKYANGVDEPVTTITSKAEHLLISSTLIQTGYGERDGQAPRVPGLGKPLGTVVAGGAKHALVAAFLAKHFGGNETPGWPLTKPISTVTAVDHHAVVTSNLVKLRGTCKDGQPVDEPLATVSAQGTHLGEVRAFLLKYYGTDQDPRLEEPMHTIPTKDRFGLVMVRGESYQIVDIGMRMLTPRELFRAQGFADTYQIEVGAGGTPLTKTAQVRMCGNSVCPPLAAAIVRAQFADQTIEVAA